MSGGLCLLVCETVAEEISAVVEAWPDVTARAFSCGCGRSRALSWSVLRALIPEGCQRVHLISGNVHALGAPPSDLPSARVIALEQCLHLVAPPRGAAALVKEGAYVVTPTWLMRWRVHLEGLGLFEPEMGPLFREIASELVLFDTEIDAEAPRRLEEMGAALGLPTRRIVIGLDYARARLSQEVDGWRLERERDEARARARQHARELSEHVTAMDLLSQLAQLRGEEEVIRSILETLQMLFAPQRLCYATRVGEQLRAPPDAPQDLAEALEGLERDYAPTPSGRGFLLRVRHEGEVLGAVAVDELAFPEHHGRYLNLALSIIGVCGLAVGNARNQRRLVEMEKMASLSGLVAGVAHEINTPTGIARAAASGLEARTAALEARFEARRMTMEDLSGYLQAASSSAGLIHKHLQRIGRLIEAFRQVAVEPQQAQARVICLRGLIEDVIEGVGARLDPARIALTLSCPESLKVKGDPEAWTSILLNLITNSLKHGFPRRARGQIWIEACVEGERLTLSYVDDGEGLTGEASRRLFDPFFTTKPQEGMGLGMHLVYNLITHRLRGAIRHERPSTGGARFSIEVPYEPAG